MGGPIDDLGTTCRYLPELGETEDVAGHISMRPVREPVGGRATVTAVATRPAKAAVAVVPEARVLAAAS